MSSVQSIVLALLTLTGRLFVLVQQNIVSKQSMTELEDNHHFNGMKPFLRLLSLLFLLHFLSRPPLLFQQHRCHHHLKILLRRWPQRNFCSNLERMEGREESIKFLERMEKGREVSIKFFLVKTWQTNKEKITRGTNIIMEDILIMVPLMNNLLPRLMITHRLMTMVHYLMMTRTGMRETKWISWSVETMVVPTSQNALWKQTRVGLDSNWELFPKVLVNKVTFSSISFSHSSLYRKEKEREGFLVLLCIYFPTNVHIQKEWWLHPESI